MSRLSSHLLVPSENAAELPELLAQARRGDSDAFCALCRAHQARLLRQALALSGRLVLAEDLAQETLVAAWKSLGRYDARCQFFTWLCGIMINRYRNVLRKRQPPAFSPLSLSEHEGIERILENTVDPGATPAETVETAERALFLRQCLDRLPEKQRAVIYLRFYVDDSLEGIAAALGCSVGTIKSRLFHALDRLAQMPELQRYFH